MSDIEDQIRRMATARARVRAEIAVAMAMLPDDCQSELHYNGHRRAAERYPQYAQLIAEMGATP